MRRALILAAASSAWLACGGGGGGEKPDITFTLTTDGGATSVTSGRSLGVQAQVANSAQGVTWRLAGPACPGACGTLAASGLAATYTAPGALAVQLTVRVEATSVEDPTRVGSLELTAVPCPANSGLLSGHYAFLLQGFHQGTGNGVAAIGSLEADGCGLVTGGSADFYFGPGVGQSGGSLVSGSYAIGDDRRGTITLGASQSSVHLAVGLGVVSGGVATKGALVTTDGGTVPVLSGAMYRQDPTAFAASGLSGPYAFVLNGWDGAGPREALGSTVVADGAGALAGGVLDDMVFGNPGSLTTASWAGTLTAPSVNGRTQLTAPVLTGATGSAVLYVATRTHALMLISDPTGAGRVLSGRLLAQAGPFDATSLSGTCVTFQAANYDQPGYEGLNSTVLALFTADGAGHLAATSVDQSFGGNNYFSDTGSGLDVHYSYEVAADGRANIVVVPPDTSGGIWYLLGPNTALMLGFDKGVSVGQILPQAGGPFSASTLAGSWLVSQAPGGTLGSASSAGVATSDGGGTLATVLDVSRYGVFTAGTAASASISVAANGRATDTAGQVYYVVNPARVVRTNQGSYDAATWFPVVQVLDR